MLPVYHCGRGGTVSLYNDRVESLIHAADRLKGRAESIIQMLMREGEKLTPDDYESLSLQLRQANDLASHTVIAVIARIRTALHTPT
jgi:hypothetical protein